MNGKLPSDWDSLLKEARKQNKTFVEVTID